MLLVVVKRNSRLTVSDETLTNLVKELPGIVASNLSAPADNGTLRPDEVEVDVHERHPMDIPGKDLQIVVFAHDYPSRLANLAERQEHMRLAVGNLVPREADAFLWVILAQTAYGEIPREI